MITTGIRKQALVLGLLPVTVIALLLCAYFITSQLTSLDEMQKSQGLAISEQLAAASEYGVVSGNSEVLKSLTSTLIKDRDVTAIRITDSLQNNLLVTGDFILGIDPRHYINTPTVCASDTSATIFCAPIYKVLLPVSDYDEDLANVTNISDSEIVGYVYIELSSQSLVERREEAIIRAIIITITILMITGLFAVRTAVNIAQPIENLTQTVSQVEHGDLDITIADASGAEIKSLQNGIRSMVTALRDHHTHLEEMINKRTAELIKEREQAEQAVLAKSKFLAAASHDLRQPLHALRLFIDILNRRVDDQDVTSLINDINKSADALEELFNNLLDLSRVEANVITPEFSDFPLQYLFERIRTDYAGIAYKKRLWFRIVNTKAVINCDFSMLERILRNLISNAIRYTKTGGVLVGCRRRNGRLAIEVRDTGIGIPESELKSIFSEFHQVANPERDRSKGLGLGLAIADGLAKLLGEEISVHSEIGEGTVFSITVSFGGEHEIEKKRISPVPVEHDLSGTNIIFIDDEEAVRTAMQHILDECKCNSIIGEDIDQIIQQLDDKNIIPDVIIADYRLRGEKTGLDAIAELRERYGSAIKAMIVTGETAPAWVKEAESNDSHILFKPVKAEEIYAEIRKLLGL